MGQTEHNPVTINSSGEVLHSFVYQGFQYVIWKDESLATEDAQLLRLHEQQLVHIEDEQEWEQVADFIDDYLYQQ